MGVLEVSLETLASLEMPVSLETVASLEMPVSLETLVSLGDAGELGDGGEPGDAGELGDAGESGDPGEPGYDGYAPINGDMPASEGGGVAYTVVVITDVTKKNNSSKMSAFPIMANFCLYIYFSSLSYNLE